MENFENKIADTLHEDSSNRAEMTENHFSEIREETSSTLSAEREAKCPEPTQEEIDAEARRIMHYIVKKHAKTWTELAKY